MRFAYADPPYIGQAWRHYRKHPDYAGEVDHAALVRRLTDFDGWALSLSMRSLRTILPMCPDDVLVLAWVKPMSPPLGDKRTYSWEPVVVKALRNPRDYTRTHLIQSPPGFFGHRIGPGHVMGEKPEEFSRWLFEAAGLLPDDDFVDLFPGSGAVGRAWDGWRAQLGLGFSA